MESILDTGQERHCQLCGATAFLERHHVFGGALRDKSDHYGLTLTLCHRCHNEPPFGVHYNRQTSDYVKARAQQQAMQAYGWTTEQFVDLFGRNYI